jgi:signal transduction histidine kinase
VSRPRLTVRARLTLLYTGLFAACGAVIVAVSYTLMARLPALGQDQQTVSPYEAKGRGPDVSAGILAQCQAQQNPSSPDKPALSNCVQLLEQQGAQHQQALTLSHLLQYSVITLAVVLALAAVLGWVFGGRVLRPVQQITTAARAASEHNLSARVALRGPRDELRELAQTFDDMLGRLQAAFESQERFMANASHELRTPLAVMRATIDVVLGNPDSTPDDLRGMAVDIRAAVDHAEHLVGALLLLARNERGLTIREDVDLATTAEDVLDTADVGDCQVHATLEPAVICGDPVLSMRLIANLVDNAARYNVPGGGIWISTGSAAEGSQLTVANTGPVISAAEAGRIFQPFERLSDRTSHDGFGLGLAIVASIAAVHGGTVAALPRADGGLCVTVTIPARDLTGETPARSEQSRSIPLSRTGAGFPSQETWVVRAGGQPGRPVIRRRASALPPSPGSAREPS